MKRLFYSVFLFILLNRLQLHPLHAQWVQTSLDSVTVWAFATSGTNLFAAGEGVFRSTSDGATWNPINSSVPTGVFALAVSGSNLFAGGPGVFLSTNNGTNWTSVDSGLGVYGILSLAVGSIGPSGANLFASTFTLAPFQPSRVFLSSNDGKSWAQPDSNFAVSDIHALLLSGSNLFAASWGSGVFLSTNNGTSWTAVNSGLTSTIITSLAVIGSKLFAGTGDGVFRSTNNGTSWTAASTGLPNTTVRAFAVSGLNLFAGTEGSGIYLSTNEGARWTAVNSGLTVLALAVSGNYLFAGTYYGGVWRRPLSEMFATGVEDKQGSSPSRFVLEQNYPNPFNPSTVISYQLPVYSHVAMRVFDILGREVATLVNEERNAGSYIVQWNAEGFASGVYFYRVDAGPYSQTRKLILMK